MHKITELSSRFDVHNSPCGNCSQLMENVSILKVYVSHDSTIPLDDLKRLKINVHECEHCGHIALMYTSVLVVDSSKYATCFFPSYSYSIIENMIEHSKLLDWISSQLIPDDLEKIGDLNDESIEGDLNIVEWLSISERELYARVKGMAKYIESEKYPMVYRVMYLFSCVLEDFEVTLRESEINTYFGGAILYCLDNFSQLVEIPSGEENVYEKKYFLFVSIYLIFIFRFKKFVVELTKKTESADILNKFLGNLEITKEEYKELLTSVIEVLKQEESYDANENIFLNMMEYALEEQNVKNELSGLSTLIDYYVSTNKPLEALAFSERLARRSVKEQDIMYQAVACFGVGRTADMLGNTQKALANFRYAAQLASEAGNALTYGVSMVELAKAEGGHGGIEQSIIYIKEAIRAFELNESWRHRLVDCLILAARFYVRLRDFDAMAKSLNRAMGISEKIEGYRKNEIKELSSYLDSSISNEFVTDIYVEQLIKKYEVLNGDIIARIEVLNDILSALIQIDQGISTRIEFYKEKIFKEIKNEYNNLLDIREKLHLCNTLSWLDSLSEGTESEYLKLCLEIGRGVVESQDIQHDSYTELTAYFYYAGYCETSKDFETALKFYTKAGFVYERIRVTMTDEEYKKVFQGDFNKIFHRVIRLIFNLHTVEEIQMSEALIERVFTFSEFSKNRLLNDRFASGNSYFIGNNIYSLPKIRERLSEHSSILQWTMIPHNPDIQLDGYWLGMLITKDACRFYRCELESTYELVSNHNDEIDKILRQPFLIANYEASNEKDKSHTLIELENMREQLKNRMFPPEILRYLIDKRINKLSIVPEYYLFNVPWNCITLEYMNTVEHLENLVCEVAPSSSVMHNVQNQKSNENIGDSKILLISGGTHDLKSMTTNIENLLNSFPDTSQNHINHISGEGVTKEVFWEECKDSSIVIYYGHSIFLENNNNASVQAGLTFIGEDGKPDLLTISEMNSDFESKPLEKCKLFFAASCFGGKTSFRSAGYVKEFEAISSSILSLGASCVICCYYPVTMSTITALLPYVLEGILANETFDKVFRNSLKKFTAANSYTFHSDPFFWSNLLVYGNSSLSLHSE